MPKGIYKRIINKKTHCIHGHEYTPENSYTTASDGRRRCIKCFKLRLRYYWTKESQRKYRKRRPDVSARAVKKWNSENPVERKAQYLLNKAVLKGVVLKRSCQVCDEPRSDGHHYDYTKPLEVIWLCRLHHKELHRGVLDESLIKNH